MTKIKHSQNIVLLLALGILHILGFSALGNLQPLSGEFTQNEGWLTATTKTVLEAPFAANDNLIILRGRTGTNPEGIRLNFLGSNGKEAVNSENKPMDSLTWSTTDLTVHGDNNIYPDAILKMPRPMQYFVRPYLKLYTKDKRKEIIAKWDSLPKASAHEFSVEIRKMSDGKFQFWFDGNFMQEYLPADVSLLRVTLAPGASLKEFKVTQEQGFSVGEDISLPITSFPRPQGMENAQITLNPGVKLPKSFASLNGHGAENIAIDGLPIIPGLGTDDLQSFYFRRSAVDNFAEQRIFTVPLATYSYANILVASENDPSKTSAFTLRITRYGNSRGNAMADTIVHIPAADAKDSPAAQRVGVVHYGPADARKEAPLWLLRVPLKNGLIQDILYSDKRKNEAMGTYQYLDVELMEPLHNVEKADTFPPPQEVVYRQYVLSDPQFAPYDMYTKVWEPQPSDVHVFALSLETAPAAMEVRSNSGMQVFYAADNPQFEANVTAIAPGTYTLFWDYADTEGKLVASGKKSVTLEAGARETITAPVTVGNGWYAARFRLVDKKDQNLVDYRTSFVMLPPDTRKAGLESPFVGWWFGKNHSSDISLDEVGPLLQRLGIRRVELPEDMPESVTLPKYGFTHSTVRFAYVGGARGLRDFRDGKMTLEQAVAYHEADIRRHLELWPSIDRMYVFHESGNAGAPFPSELWGEPARSFADADGENSPEALLRKEGMEIPEATVKAREEYQKNWPKRMEYLTAMAKMVREKFPKLKMQYGNTGNSLQMLGEIFRQKFPRQYIDTIASESLGQTIIPERDMTDSMQDGWYVRELARKMGYGDVPITASTEWIGRMTEQLGLRKQAQWKARDGILALAYGYDTISIAGINDAGDAYYYSIWANGGLTGRYPIMAPKPAYAAVATLTRVLDQAKFKRWIPTGSTVCYLAEFQTGDQWTYALWTPRGTRELTLTFKDDAKRSLIDLYGRQSFLTGKEPHLLASPSVQYVVSKTPVQSAAVGASSFPDDLAKVPEKPLQTVEFDSLDVISNVPDPAMENAYAKRDLGKLVQGDFEIREVDDPEMGKCLEVELKPGKDIRLDQTEFANLILQHPLTTKAKNAGIWIKGNGGWGEVDIIKNHWGPWADNQNLHMNWPGEATLNFEGWNFIIYPYYDWARTTGTYSSTIVKGLRIKFPQTTLVGTERVPVKNQKVRIKKMVFF